MRKLYVGILASACIGTIADAHDNDGPDSSICIRSHEVSLHVNTKSVTQLDQVGTVVITSKDFFPPGIPGVQCKLVGHIDPTLSNFAKGELVINHHISECVANSQSLQGTFATLHDTGKVRYQVGTISYADEQIRHIDPHSPPTGIFDGSIKPLHLKIAMSIDATTGQNVGGGYGLLLRKERCLANE